MYPHMYVAFNGYFWDQPRTGSGQYLRHLWEALNGLSFTSPSPGSGHDTFSMLLPPGGSQPSSPDSSVSVGPHSRVTYGRRAPIVGGKAGNLDKLLWEAWQVARMAKAQKAQLLHVPYFMAPYPVPGIKSCPVVVTAHDMIPWVVKGYSGSGAVRLYLAMAAASVKRADIIIADSETSRRDVIRVLGVSPRKVRTVYLGMESHPHYNDHDLYQARARLDLPNNYAFYMGGFDARKNVPLLLRSWRAALDLLHGDEAAKPLLVIGGLVPEPGGINPDIMAQAERLGLTGPDAPVRFIGRVSEDNKPLLMAAARLFIYPSAYEGFGLDPLEAMSVGCPVVSSSGGSLKEVVGDAGLLVPPGDEAAMTAAIVHAWQDADLRSNLSQKGKQRALRFTWERTAQQTQLLYSEVLAKRGRARKT